MAPKRKLREFIVTARVTLDGATTNVEAYDEDEARELVRRLECDGFDYSNTTLVNWQATDAEPNDA